MAGSPRFLSHVWIGVWEEVMMRLLPLAFIAIILSLLPWPSVAFADTLVSAPPVAVPPLVFEDADGIQHALSDYRGRFVLLNIWATWCAPCVGEMQSLETLQKNFDEKKLIVLPLSENRDAASITAFYRAKNISRLPVAIDKAGTARQALRLRGMPTTILIDDKGMEIARKEGDADWASPDAASELAAKTSVKPLK